MTQDLTTSRRLAPEDIRPGMFVAVSAKLYEIFPYWLAGCTPGVSIEMIRFTGFVRTDGSPRRVLSVCLPFVMTECAKGEVEMLDIRRDTLVQLDEMFGLELFTRPDTDRCSCSEF